MANVGHILMLVIFVEATHMREIFKGLHAKVGRSRYLLGLLVEDIMYCFHRTVKYYRV